MGKPDLAETPAPPPLAGLRPLLRHAAVDRWVVPPACAARAIHARRDGQLPEARGRAIRASETAGRGGSRCGGNSRPPIVAFYRRRAYSARLRGTPERSDGTAARPARPE